MFPTVKEITAASEAVKPKAQQLKPTQKTYRKQNSEVEKKKNMRRLFVLNAVTLNSNLKAIQESLQPFQSSQPSGL